MGKDFQRTFGIEIECIAPAGLSRMQLAANLTRAGVPAREIGYSQHHFHDVWGVKTDGSLGNVSCGYEIVSPPLLGERGLEQVDKVCFALVQQGCTITKTCGLHVHIDARRPCPLDIAAFRRLALLYVQHESIIDACMPESRRGAVPSEYIRGVASAPPSAIMACQDVRSIARVLRLGTSSPAQQRLSQLRRRRSSQSSLEDREEARAWRYVKLNLTASWLHGTVEFRHHSGTLESQKIRNWVYACQRMVEYALRGDDAEIVSESRRMIKAVRRGTKRAIAYDMLLRPEGCTLAEILAATGWRQASVVSIGRDYGMTMWRARVNGVSHYWGSLSNELRGFTPIGVNPRRVEEVPRVQRRTPRYRPRPGSAIASTGVRRSSTPAANLDEFCARLGMDEDEVKFWKDRAAMFAKATMAVTMEPPTRPSDLPRPSILDRLRMGETI